MALSLMQRSNPIITKLCWSTRHMLKGTYSICRPIKCVHMKSELIKIQNLHRTRYYNVNSNEACCIYYILSSQNIKGFKLVEIKTHSLYYVCSNDNDNKWRTTRVVLVGNTRE